VKNCNSLRLPWEDAADPKVAAAHSLGTAALHSLTNVPTKISGVGRSNSHINIMLRGSEKKFRVA